MGLTDAQVVRRIELPLALPAIFGGIRTSAVNVVATATIAPLAGVLTLGDSILSANVYGDDGRLAAAILVASARGRDGARCSARLQRAVTPTGQLAQVIAPPEEACHRMQDSTSWETRHPSLTDALAGGAGSTGDGPGRRRMRRRRGVDRQPSEGAAAAAEPIEENPDNAGTSITVGSKNFTEQFILGEIYAQALEAAGYDG